MFYLSWTSLDLKFRLHLGYDTNITFDRYFSSLNSQFNNLLIKIQTSQSLRILLIIEEPITIKTKNKKPYTFEIDVKHPCQAPNFLPQTPTIPSKSSPYQNTFS